MGTKQPPAYQRIANNLRDRITTGDLAPGGQLPTEKDLAARYGVSRLTARHALSVLTSEGLIVARRPQGHFVRKRQTMIFKPQLESKPPKTRKHDRFMQQMIDQGDVGYQDIAVAVIAAPPLVADQLQLPPGTLVAARTRLRSINGEVVNTNDSHFPYDIVQGTAIMDPADIAHGTNDYLAGLGYAQVRAVDRIQCRMPTPEEKARLDLGPGTPVMVHTITGYNIDDRPVRFTINVLAGDRNVVIYEREWK